MPSAGLAHVASASFLASRLVPSGGFALALAGGVALARAAQRSGFRTSYGASLAALLQTIAIMGPSRIGVPLTQAVSAPVLGRMEHRGFGTASQALVAAAVRVASNVPFTAFYIWVIVGVEAYAGSYDAILGRLLFFLPEGTEGALLATGIGLVFWTVVASIVQALVYRRGLHRWPAETDPAVAGAPDAPRPEAEPGPSAPARVGRFDPRAAALAAVVAFGLLIASTAWVLLGAVALWLAVAWAVSNGDRSVVRPGLALTGVLAFGTLVIGLIGGIGIEMTLRRTLRAALLVLVATWLRSAAGEAGLREVFRRVLRRLAWFPGVREGIAVLDGLGSTDALAASGRRLAAKLEHVPLQPVVLADAVLDWVVGEAGRYPVAAATPPTRLRARLRDGALIACVIAAAAALPLAA